MQRSFSPRIFAGLAVVCCFILHGELLGQGLRRDEAAPVPAVVQDAPAPTEAATPPPTVEVSVAAPAAPALTVALAAELKQLDGVLVVLNSAASHAADAARLRFRILTTQREQESLVAKVKERPGCGRGSEPKISKELIIWASGKRL